MILLHDKLKDKKIKLLIFFCNSKDYDIGHNQTNHINSNVTYTVACQHKTNILFTCHHFFLFLKGPVGGEQSVHLGPGRLTKTFQSPLGHHRMMHQRQNRTQDMRCEIGLGIRPQLLGHPVMVLSTLTKIHLFTKMLLQRKEK